MKFRKRFYVMLIVCVVAAVLKFQIGSESVEDVEHFRGANIQSDVFNPMIAQNINSTPLTLTLNEQVYTSKKDGVFMSDELNLCIPYKKLMEGLKCSAHLYDGKRLVILQADTEIQMELGAEVMSVNGEDIKISQGIFEKDGEVFVPLQPLQDTLHFSLTFDMEENKAVGVSNLETSYLPSAFSLVDYNRVGKVKDQKELGTCWAVASLSAMESELLPEQRMEFSADHMSMRNGFSSDQTSGGAYTMGMAYLTSWQGPVYENDDPYGDGVSPDGLKPVKHVQEIQLLESQNVEEIKDEVFKYGAVQTSIYISTNNYYYHKKDASYYYYGNKAVNHDVVIVGWDDSYSAEHFSRVPEGDGAFLCMNSWGEDFGNNGFFYVSYYDTNIGKHAICYTGIEDTNNYANIYQADLHGWSGQIGYNKSTIYAANIFRAKQEEKLSAVGFYATGRDTTYEIYVVPEFNTAPDLDNAYSVASGTISKAGFYTIPLEYATRIKKGNNFAVLIKLTTPGSNRPLAVEYADENSKVEINLNDGRGYISANGVKWESTEENYKCNICLKAYTKE